uniref:Cytochrome P450 n=1 Tax=Phanerodontia chrysosporium TaxID=2822231 RepID=G5EJN4_PHACH|nr:cytochrome P450 [Phanerodontia chrysosporium]
MLLFAAVSTVLALLLASLLTKARRKARNLPPGPKPLPFIGNAHQIPPENEWIKFKEWGDEYGDLVKIKMPGSMLYIVNKRKVVDELFEARSAVYCSRPNFIMASLSGWDHSIPTLPYGQRLRESRKLLKKGTSPAAVKTYHPYINRDLPFFLENMLSTPDKFVEHYNRNAARIALKIAYGYEGITEDERIIQGGVKAMEVFSATAVPGVWAVDTFPFLRHLPSWAPFSSFKVFAERCKRITDEALNTPFYEVKQRLENGTADGSFTSVMLSTEKLDPETEEIIKWCATGIFTGQFDTTTATLSWFTMAMAKYPDVQKKAQAEIDRVVGRDRLPEVGDRDSLPYTWAILQETMRWHPTVALVPHMAVQDDTYGGYFVPAGTTVIANVWAMMHDENVYHDADKFMPERFCEEGAPDSLSVVFGFGRRICPGLVVAQTHMFVTIASILATLNISKARDNAGNVIEPREDAKSGVINFPKPFQVSITPRSDAAIQLIRRSVEHSKTLPDKLELFSP